MWCFVTDSEIDRSVPESKAQLFNYREDIANNEQSWCNQITGKYKFAWAMTFGMSDLCGNYLKSCCAYFLTQYPIQNNLQRLLQLRTKIHSTSDQTARYFEWTNPRRSLIVSGSMTKIFEIHIKLFSEWQPKPHNLTLNIPWNNIGSIVPLPK